MQGKNMLSLSQKNCAPGGRRQLPRIKKEKRTAVAPQRGDKSGLGGLHNDLTGGSAAHARARPPVLWAAA